MLKLYQMEKTTNGRNHKKKPRKYHKPRPFKKTVFLKTKNACMFWCNTWLLPSLRKFLNKTYTANQGGSSWLPAPEPPARAPHAPASDGTGRNLASGGKWHWASSKAPNRWDSRDAKNAAMTTVCCDPHAAPETKLAQMTGPSTKELSAMIHFKPTLRTIIHIVNFYYLMVENMKQLLNFKPTYSQFLFQNISYYSLYRIRLKTLLKSSRYIKESLHY